MKVSYNGNIARQYLGDIDLDYLSGSFEEAIAQIQKQKNSYEENYVEKASLVRGFYADSIGKADIYSSGEQRELKFDRLFLEVNDYQDYGDDYSRKRLEVYGERTATESELSALENQKNAAAKQQQARERKEFERLKKQFEG
jgi:hypothetical protein